MVRWGTGSAAGDRHSQSARPSKTASRLRGVLYIGHCPDAPSDDQADQSRALSTLSEQRILQRISLDPPHFIDFSPYIGSDH